MTTQLGNSLEDQKNTVVRISLCKRVCVCFQNDCDDSVWHLISSK